MFLHGYSLLIIALSGTGTRGPSVSLQIRGLQMPKAYVSDDPPRRKHDASRSSKDIIANIGFCCNIEFKKSRF